MAKDGVLLLAHGTVRNNSELTGFLTTIRRGRPPSEALLQEMEHRYDAIGGSPLLRLTNEQATALAEKLGKPCFVAMRLWHPTVEEVLPEIAAQGVERLCLLPLAPFSVQVYDAAARRAQQQLEGAARDVELVSCAPWGAHPGFIEAQAELVRRHLPQGPCELILTAHSLPTRVIAAGDGYAEQSSACAAAVAHRLGRDFHLAYQSEGADGGDWLGPGLRQTLEACAARGARQVVIAPFGFLADHVETLYDLDIEARAWTRELGLELTRVPALNTDERFIAALADIAAAALA